MPAAPDTAIARRHSALAKSDDVYTKCDHRLWKFAVYDGVHGGRELANICGISGLDALRSLIREPASKVLDFGCGSGEACIYVAEKFACTVAGIDINSAQIERAQKRLQLLESETARRLTFICADVTELKPTNFDLIYSLDTLTLVGDLAATLAAIRRALNPGATFFIADLLAGPNLDQRTREFSWSEDGMINLMDRRAFDDIIRRSGFSSCHWLDQTEMAVRTFGAIGARLKQYTCGSDAAEVSLLQEWMHSSELYLHAFAERRLEYFWCSALA